MSIQMFGISMRMLPPHFYMNVAFDLFYLFVDLLVEICVVYRSFDLLIYPKLNLIDVFKFNFILLSPEKKIWSYVRAFLSLTTNAR